MDNMRYEKKFVIPEKYNYYLQKLIALHPAIFIKRFPERQVNNIYFDSPDYNSFIDNIEGNTYRTKIRLRWYGMEFPYISKPILEIKNKIGLSGYKIFKKIPSFKIDINNAIYSIKNNIITDELFKLKKVSPILINQYSRKYYSSFDNKFRITIDTNLMYSPIKNKIDKQLLIKPVMDTIIMELKYHPSLDNEAASVTNFFPFRLAKNSKYANGVYLLLGK